MRSEKEIENDDLFIVSMNDSINAEVSSNMRLKLILEVLLDVRDLLQHLDKRSAND